MDLKNEKNKVDEIENAVYNELKQFGFRKHGRTLHRFVSDDISQVIHFQVGRNNLSGKMCVNIGIRIPERVERSFFYEKVKELFMERRISQQSKVVLSPYTVQVMHT